MYTIGAYVHLQFGGRKKNKEAEFLVLFGRIRALCAFECSLQFKFNSIFV